MDLVDGISFLLLAMSTFALSEALLSILRPTKDTRSDEEKALKSLGSMKLSKAEVKTMVPVIGRSSILGFFTGVLPGAGATIASFLAYGMERNLASAKEKLQFGKGSIRGLTAPETANNAACSGSFVPLLTLGIPGSGTTAVMMGALISYGVQPGPRLFVEQPAVFWSVIISMYIGNVVLLILNLPLIPYISRLLALPQQLLVPFVLFFSLIGVYLVTFNTMDIHDGASRGNRHWPASVELSDGANLLGFILGSMMEENLRRALMISDGSLSFLWERPITLVILIISMIFLIAPLLGNTREWLRNRKALPNDGEM
jgi:putative tricarboxylic transport membrane protein